LSLSLIDLLVAIAAAAIASFATWRFRRRQTVLTPSSRRILFPFFGVALSQSALDAALRLCRAEEATLVPAYLARVPLTLALDAPLPRQAAQALPTLEAIEQRALSAGVPVDSRIERGRTRRHAIRELIDHEHYDRIVAAASANGNDGFSADDIAWLLGHAPGEIVILRAATLDSDPVRWPIRSPQKPQLAGLG
jgi:nucleotide-binding universal stress UspA family protein